MACAICNGQSYEPCMFCGDSYDPNDPRSKERMEFKRLLWLKMKKFNQPSTGIPELDSEIKQSFGDWLSSDIRIKYTKILKINQKAIKDALKGIKF